MKRLVTTLSFLILFIAALAGHAMATTVTASNLTFTITPGTTTIMLQGTVSDSSTATYQINGSGCAGCTAPSHGTIPYFNSNTGVLTYAPSNGATSDSFTFTVTANSVTSSQGTVTITITATTTTISAHLYKLDGITPRSGTVTFIPTQSAYSPSGLVTPSGSVSAALNGTGLFTVTLYATTSLNPQTFVQEYFTDSNGATREFIGLYNVPASSSTINDAGWAAQQVTDTNLMKRFVFASLSSVEALRNSLSGVTSVFGRTGAVTAQTGDYTAAQVSNAVDKTTSNTFTSGNLQTLLYNNLGATSFDVLNLQNTTNATSGTPVQVSPTIGFTGSRWDTTNTRAVVYDGLITMVPSAGGSGNGSARLAFSFDFSIPSISTFAPVTEVASIDSSGNATLNGGITTKGSIALQSSISVPGRLQFTDLSGTNASLTFNTGSTATLDLPSNNGSNGQHIVTDGLGGLSFSNTAIKVLLPGAGCNNATAGPFWDLPTSNSATANCVTGTNIQKGVLDFGTSSSAQTTLYLPADFTGSVDVRLIWFTSSTSGNCKWLVSTAFTADNASATDDPAFNTANTVTTAAPGTANQITNSSITSITITGSGANKLMHLKVARDGSETSPITTGRLVAVEVTLRRQM